MKKTTILLSVASTLLLTACSKMGTFTQDNFTVTPTPLEYVAGEVPATISATLPAKFMHKKAIVTCTPVLRWQGGEAQGNSATLQGEKVEANNQIISYKNGGNATLRTAFPYQQGMESSELFMTFNARKGGKTISLPDVKIGYGVVGTAALVSRTVKSAATGSGQDNFQRVISQKQAATIKFLIAQSNLRGSELNSENVQQFIQTLRNIKSDEQSLVLNNVEISAYASPDGGYAFNERLAENRGKTSEGFVNEQLKKNQLDTDIDMHYTAEDWEGFQELISQSNLQDKDLILRVLSMYQDPEQREQEIRNIASVYTELADAVLPELRRARMTINYDVIGRNDDQIRAAFRQDASQLSVEELLYLANILSTTDSEKSEVLTRTTELYPNDYRAYNNLAEIAMRQGNLDKAQTLLSKALQHNASAPEANANLGLLALQSGNVADTELFLSKAAGSNNIDEALGNLYIAQGKYNQAAAKLQNSATNSALLANILAQDYASAQKTLKAIKTPDSNTYYLQALLGARMQDEDGLRQGLTSLLSADPAMAQRAATDLEFANYANLVKSIVR